MKLRSIIPLLLLCCAPLSLGQVDSDRTGFSVVVNNEIYPYREFAVYVLPSEHLDICVVAANIQPFELTASAGELDYVSSCRWIWTAPEEAGLQTVKILRDGELAMALNVFVMVPASSIEDGYIGRYEIGVYPPPLEFSPIYLPPDGYIEVTEEMLSIPVSPNFRLGQFVTPLEGEFPKYIALRERLILKLETLLDALNTDGVSADSLSIVSAYMTPAYNAEIGGQEHHRQIYGGGATIIVDRDGDGKMDDIDGNGVLDDADGVRLFDFVDELFSIPGKEYLRGGLYLYRGVSSGTALMMDARGFRKRWPNDGEVPPLPENLRAKHSRQFAD